MGDSRKLLLEPMYNALPAPYGKGPEQMDAMLELYRADLDEYDDKTLGTVRADVMRHCSKWPTLSELITKCNAERGKRARQAEQMKHQFTQEELFMSPAGKEALRRRHAKNILCLMQTENRIPDLPEATRLIDGWEAERASLDVDKEVSGCKSQKLRNTLLQAYKAMESAEQHLQDRYT